MMEGYFNSSKNDRPGAKSSGHVLHLVGQSGRRDCRPYVTATVSGVRRPSTIGFGGDCRLVDVRFCSQAPNKDRARSVAFGQTPVIQTPKLGSRIMRYELADYEWTAIKPMLPNKPRGVPRVNDRRVLNGIFWALRSGAPWRDLPEAFAVYQLLQPLCQVAESGCLEPYHTRACGRP